MLLSVFKCKLHSAVLTDANLYYEGSITIDKELMNKAGIKPYEKVHVVNLNNGSRLETYAIKGEKRGEICLNGAAARLGHKGDKVIIIAYALVEEKEYDNHECKAVFLDDNNNVKDVKQWKISQL